MTLEQANKGKGERLSEMNLYHWADERRMPDMLLQLLRVPDIPEDLQKQLLQAHKEVEQLGAVTYPTKARVEYYLHQYQEYILELVNKLGK